MIIRETENMLSKIKEDLKNFDDIESKKVLEHLSKKCKKILVCDNAWWLPESSYKMPMYVKKYLTEYFKKDKIFWLFDFPIIGEFGKKIYHKSILTLESRVLNIGDVFWFYELGGFNIYGSSVDHPELVKVVRINPEDERFWAEVIFQYIYPIRKTATYSICYNQSYINQIKGYMSWDYFVPKRTNKNERPKE